MEILFKFWIFFSAVIILVTTLYARFKRRFRTSTSIVLARQEIHKNHKAVEYELTVDYDEIVESFEKYSMYWSVELGSDVKQIQLWFGVGMFKKLELNVV